jgi:hypothetical protein
MYSREAYIIWLAGFYEGEGSCGYYKANNSKGRLTVSVSQKEIEVLQEIRDFFGFGSVGLYRAGTLAECGSYQTSNSKAKELLLELLPHIRSTRKRDQITKAIREYNAVREITA